MIPAVLVLGATATLFADVGLEYYMPAGPAFCLAVVVGIVVGLLVVCGVFLERIATHCEDAMAEEKTEKEVARA